MINILIKKIEELDYKGTINEFNADIKKTVKKAVTNNEPLTLVSFTCSTINSEYLFSATPWLYISLDPEGNNLTPDTYRLQQVLLELKKIYSKVNLKIVIGNTDPYYIYLQQFKNYPAKEDLLWKMFSDRWENYEKEFTRWINSKMSQIEVEVLSWYKFEQGIERTGKISFENEYKVVYENIYSYFNEAQIKFELKKLQNQFGKGKYFEKIDRPDDNLLLDWVKRKFAEYSVQGRWMYENITNVILIQNEKPSNLRSQMYQPLIKKKYNDVLPIVYFLGVDNTGYN